MKPGATYSKSCHFLLICLAFVLWVLLSTAAHGQERIRLKYGLGVSGGVEASFIHQRPYMQVYSLFPRVDFSLYRALDLELEGNFSYYFINAEKNIYFAGLNGNVLFKPLQWQWGSIFILAGGGLGYDSNRDRNVRQLGSSRLGGILQTGAGVTVHLKDRWEFRAEYRLYHLSEPLINDTGLNTHNLVLGVAF